jgi:hypothetical protein
MGKYRWGRFPAFFMAGKMGLFRLRFFYKMECEHVFVFGG